MRTMDVVSGVVIQGLYVTYFMVVRGMLSVWNCSKKSNGVSVLTADPSYSCDTVRNVVTRASGGLCWVVDGFRPHAKI